MCRWAERCSSTDAFHDGATGALARLFGSQVAGRGARLSIGKLAGDVVTFLSPLPHNLKYCVLEERLAVCRFACDARIPAWALEGGFFCVVRTRDELSIVRTEDVCGEDRMPDGGLVECGWVALKLGGRFHFR
jgi:uncharacterized protein